MLVALVSAACFGTSGTFAKGLLLSGWSPAAAVTARVWLGALFLLVPALLSLRGRWAGARRHLGLVVAYGVIPVAGCQLAYFLAVERLQVGLALLIEYAAPVLVVGWLWVRRGERPSAMTVGGGALALVGLALVLDLFGGVRLDGIGVAWGLVAMVGAACYFVLSGHDTEDLPPVALAAGGLLVGALTLTVAGLVGVLDMATSTAPATYAGHSVVWWLPIIGLGLVSAALAYATGIIATRALGSRVASFVALTEVLAALGFAWLLLDELPRSLQLVGGVLVLAGVVVVRLGEREQVAPTPVTPV